MTEMTEAQKVIAEVVVTHELRYDDWAVKDADFYTCACGWDKSTTASVHEYADHVAAEIDKALGRLVLETAFRYTHNATGRSTILDSVDVPVARKIAGTTHTLSEASRWVSGWSEA